MNLGELLDKNPEKINIAIEIRDLIRARFEETLPLVDKKWLDMLKDKNFPKNSLEGNRLLKANIRDHVNGWINVESKAFKITNKLLRRSNLYCVLNHENKLSAARVILPIKNDEIDYEVIIINFMASFGVDRRENVKE